MHLRFRWNSELIGVMALLVSGCNQGLGVRDCQTAIDPTYTSPATGVLRLEGRFLNAETVILGYTDATGTHALPLTPPDNRASITWTGLPSGTRAYTIRISCESGELNFDETYTVK